MLGPEFLSETKEARARRGRSAAKILEAAMSPDESRLHQVGCPVLGLQRPIHLVVRDQQEIISERRQALPRDSRSPDCADSSHDSSSMAVGSLTLGWNIPCSLIVESSGEGDQRLPIMSGRSRACQSINRPFIDRGKEPLTNLSFFLKISSGRAGGGVLEYKEHRAMSLHWQDVRDLKEGSQGFDGTTTSDEIEMDGRSDAESRCPVRQ